MKNTTIPSFCMHLQRSKIGLKYWNMGGCTSEHHSPARMEYFRVNLHVYNYGK